MIYNEDLVEHKGTELPLSSIMETEFVDSQTVEIYLRNAGDIN